MSENNKKLSFWNWQEWTECWPKASRETFTFDLSECSDTFRKKWIDDNAAFNVMEKGSSVPATIASIKSFARRLDAWINSEYTNEVMTYPPTRKGFREAISKEISLTNLNNLDKSAAIALLVVRPWDVACALSLIDTNSLSDDWKILKKQYEDAYRKAPRANNFKDKKSLSDNTTFKPSINNNNNQNSYKNISKEDNIKDVESKSIENLNLSKESIKEKREDKSSGSFKWEYELTKEQKQEGDKIKAFVNELKNQSSPLAIKKEKMDGFIKKEILNSKGVGASASSFWFEDIGIHAFCSLDAQTMQDVLEFWPEHRKINLHSPVSTMSNQNIWRSIRTLNTNDRKFMVENFLPQMIDSSNFSFEQKQKMLVPMLDKTQKHPWLFEERLSLWISLGGNLDLEGPNYLDKEEKNSEESSFFTSPQRQSARDWIVKQNVDNWNKVLEEKFPIKKQNSLKF